jgi:histone H3/H4
MSGKPLKGKRPTLDGKDPSSVGGAASRGDPFSGNAAVVGAGDDVVYDDSRLLPIANTSRIMKTALPPNAKISREGEYCLCCSCCFVNHSCPISHVSNLSLSAKEFVQKCVSEFISFITSEASQKCAREKRKTVNGSDLIWALSILGMSRDTCHYLSSRSFFCAGFDTYVRNLNVYLHNLRAEEEVRIFTPRCLCFSLILRFRRPKQRKSLHPSPTLVAVPNDS